MPFLASNHYFCKAKSFLERVFVPGFCAETLIVLRSEEAKLPFDEAPSRTSLSHRVASSRSCQVSWCVASFLLALPFGGGLSASSRRRGKSLSLPLKASSAKLLSSKLVVQTRKAQCAKLLAQVLQAQFSKLCAEALQAQLAKCASASSGLPSLLLESCCLRNVSVPSCSLQSSSCRSCSLPSCCLRSCSGRSCSLPSCSCRSCSLPSCSCRKLLLVKAALVEAALF